MANYFVTDTDLTIVANAIRTKGGTSEPLVFPSGFAQAVANISSGYSITTNIINGTYSGATVMYPDSPGLTIEAIVTLTPSEGYELIGVTVTNASYVCDYETGGITLTHATGNVVITADVRQASVGLEFTPVAGTRSAMNYEVSGIGACTDTNIVIPSTYDGGKVVGIRHGAFDRSNIISVAIPYGIEDIGNYAFEGCAQLTNIVIPDSVTSIGWGAFSSCTNLSNIVIPNSVTSVGYSAFAQSGLQTITMSNNLTVIESSMFKGCWSLTDAPIPNGVEEIGSEAFSGCSLRNIVIPDTVTAIRSKAFYQGTGVYGVSSLVIPDSVIDIGQYAFTDCTIGTLRIGNGITTIPNRVFDNCNVRTVIFDDNTNLRISGQAFFNCVYLNSLTIPAAERIESYAFQYCTSLRNLVIGKDVERVEQHAFDDAYLGGGDLIFYYNGYLSNILTDGIYISDVIFSFYDHFPSLSAEFIDLNGDSQYIPLIDFFQGSGSGSGSGSGEDWPPFAIGSAIDTSREISYSENNYGYTQYYQLEVIEEGTYYMYVDSEGDSVGILYDDVGNEITSDGGSSSGDFCISEYLYIGNYYLAVKEANDGELGLYTLHVDTTGPQS